MSVVKTKSSSNELRALKPSIKTSLSTQSLPQPQQDVNIDVKQLLETHLSNNTDATKYEFNYFILQLRQKQNDPLFIKSVLVQLKPLIPMLEPRHFESNLINVLFFDIKWPVHYSNNEAMLTLLADFLIDLNSAYTQYIQKCLSMLIKLFQCAPLPPPTQSEVESGKQQHQQEPVNYESLYKLSHTLIRQLVRIAPTCKSLLIKQLDQYYPYMIKETAVQESYIRNLLLIAESFGDLRLQILEICVQKLLKIDVNCRREQILEYEFLNSDANNNNQQTVTDNETATYNQEVNMKHHLADRLDVMMLSLFNYINRNCYTTVADSTTLNWEATKLIYKDLLATFDKYILVTYGSNHVQFLLFYICGFRVQLAEGFLDYLWKKFNSIKSCSVTKQICAYYLGSLLARAKYISLSTCTATLQLMVKWIHNYIEKNYQNNTSLIFELHRTFYALCQTLFYVIIFRNRQLFNEDISAGPSGHVKSKSIMSLVKTWKLNEIVSCKLNPLRYCLPTVRSKFAKITYVHQIAYCYKIIDANNRVALPVSCNVSSNFKPVSLKASVGGERGMESGGGVNNNPLDSFFPFDPYLLTRSKSIVEKHYVEFRDVIDEEMDDEDDEDSEEEMSDDDEDDDEDEDDDGIDDDETEEEDTDSKLSDFAHHKSQINNKNLFDFDDSDLENSIE